MIAYLLPAGIALCLLFAFTNGMKDGSNVFATAVASGSLSYRQAVFWVSLAELAGPFLFGIPVALTVASGIVRVDVLPAGADSLLLIGSGIAGAILLNLLAWALRMPTSSSFALVGGLIGPALYRYGAAAIPWGVFLTRVIAALLLSPVVGILFGTLVYRLTARSLQDAPWKANEPLKRVQVASLVALGLNHGTNDSQKSMGLIALLLLLAGRLPRLQVPLWVMVVSAASLALGVGLGGTKIVRTVGYGIFRLRPLHSFDSQLASTVVLLACNLGGAPVSTTQIISSTVIGVGTASRRRAVRWGLIRGIFLGWLLTIPAAAALSVLLYLALAQLAR